MGRRFPACRRGSLPFLRRMVCTAPGKGIKANRLEVAPNPVSGNEVKISYTVSLPSPAMLQLYDNFGRLVKQERLSLDVSALKGGIYIITVRAAGGGVESKKFVLIR